MQIREQPSLVIDQTINILQWLFWSHRC